MAVLVTGGAGFIGSKLTERLLTDGSNVVVLDNLDPYYDPELKQKNLEHLRGISPDRFTFVEGTITDRSLVETILSENDVTVVFHEAAKAGVRPSVAAPMAYEKNNVEGLITLLETAAEHGVRRLVHASSSSVYGVPEYLPYDEEHPNHPKSPYAVTKLACEHYCNVFDDLRDVSTVNLRYFTVYGPRMRPNMAISNFVSRCLDDEPPIVFGDGEQTRDFTYVDDIVEANISLMDSDVADGESLNVGSTDTITIRELAEYVVEETGADVDIVHEDPKDADSRHTHADVSKARELIDYEPTTSIREGVSKFVEWYVENRDWYEPLVLNS